MKTTRTTIAALCAGLLAACGGGSSPTAPPPPPAPPPPAAAGLAFTVQPGNTVAGAPISPAIVVEVRDSAGSVVTSSVSNVTLTLGANPGGGPLSGTRTVRAQAGIATFTDISVQVAASGYSLTATASGLASATSTTFDVAPAAPRAISIEAQPGDGATGLVLAPAVDVAVRDTFGNLVPGATNAITVALGANPTGASLSGTTTVSASGGRASFTDLVLDRAGRGFTLSFSAAGLTGATSGPFDVLLGFSTIEAGFRHTCGVAVGGTAYCWGSNSFGELGDNSGVTDRKKPAAVVGGIAFASVVAGSFHTCGLDASGTAYCWGLNTDGQLGDGTNTDRAVPTLVAGGHTFTRLAAGGHTCGLDTSGTAFCWGGNASGQLGDGTATPRNGPTAVAGGLTFTEIAVRPGHTCAVAQGGAPYCWGSNAFGELGDGTTTSRTMPTLVAGGLSLRSVSVSFRHSCGLDASGAAFCWGANSLGQLGDGTTTMRTTPVAVLGGLTFADISAAGEHTCGTTTGGTLYCWGENTTGQVGDGSTVSPTVPVPVAGALTFVDAAAGGSHSCGVTGGGVAYCWGLNNLGQLGDGTKQKRLTPTRVTTP